MLFYSWNINGFNTCDRFGGLTNIIQASPDIICLQEVKVSDSDVLNTLYTFQYEQYYNFSSNKGHNGVYIYSKKRAVDEIVDIGFPRFDSEGRFLCLIFEDCILINVYMPHGGRDKKELTYKIEAYHYLVDFLSKIHDKKVIVTGDFNIAYSELEVERYQNNKNNIMFTIEEREIFEKLLDIGYVDIFRKLNPGKRSYTWWPYAFRARERNVGWRIDYCIVSMPLVEQVKNIEILKDILGSDHCPIKIELDL